MERGREDELLEGGGREGEGHVRGREGKQGRVGEDETEMNGE